MDNQTSASGRENLVWMEGITKKFGVISALESVDFGVNRGEVRALLGDNGRTLLKT
jgi:ABC-type sugar transport system ATPase subunit